jgi:multidrug efflux pump subunit AcrA (membrane-fusion protein)
MPPFNANQQQNQQQQQIQQQQIQQQQQIRQQQVQQQILAQQQIQQQQQQLRRQRALRKARKSSSPAPAPPGWSYQAGTEYPRSSQAGPRSPGSGPGSAGTQAPGQPGMPGGTARWWTQPGQHPGHAPQAATIERTGRAVTALVLGIVGMFTLITAPFAVGFGIAALARARGCQVRGKGMAVAGLVLGILGTLVLLALIVAAVVVARRYQLSTN